MPIYLVDRDLPGVTLVELAEAQRRLLAAVGRTAQAGQAVRYLHSTFVPGDSHLMCLFEASSAAVVMKVNEAARFPLLRVIEALDVTPQGATLERSGKGRLRGPGTSNKRGSKTEVTAVKNRGFLTAVLLLGTVLMVFGSATLRAHAQSKDEKAIQALIQRFDTALKAKSVNMIMTLYAPNVRVFDAGLPRQYKGTKAYRKVYEGLFAAFPGPVETRISDVALTVVGSMALTTKIETDVWTDKDGNRLSLTYRVTDVWRKISGKWLIIHEHTSFPADYETGKADFLSKP